MVTCHIDAAIPENRSVTERIARRTQKEIGTALYRAYLQRLIPEVSAMRADIDAEARDLSRPVGAIRGDPCETCLAKRLTRCRSGHGLSASQTISASATGASEISSPICWPTLRTASPSTGARAS